MLLPLLKFTFNIYIPASTSAVLIELIDYEHRDYIEDVISEKFDIETTTINEDLIGRYILCFPKTLSFKKIESVVSEINRYHLENGKEYGVQ